MVKIYYFISACLLLFSCNNSNTQVSSSNDTTDTISSIKRDTIVEKDTIAPIQVPKEETDEATKMILEFYDKYIRLQDKMLCLDCEEELIRIKKRYLSNKLIKKINKKNRALGRFRYGSYCKCPRCFHRMVGLY